MVSTIERGGFARSRHSRGLETGSYLRFIDFCISNKEEDKIPGVGAIQVRSKGS